MNKSEVDKHSFLVGTVVGFQGLKGEVKVKTSTNSPELLLDISSVRIEYARGMRPSNGQETLTVRGARIDRRLLVLSFEELDDRTAAEHLESARLFAQEEELLPLEEEEYWVKDLVGLDVFTTDGAEVGKVVSIIPSGNDILEIAPIDSPPGKTILVPFVKEIVPIVDMKRKRIEVVAVPGLLEAQ